MNDKFMQLAIEQAKQAQNDVPVGAVVVKNGKIIASGFNTKENDNDITSHAEIIVLKKASQVLGNWRLEGCDIYVTLEPCPMCAWAILQSRIKNIYFGSYDNNYGGFSVAHLERISEFKPNIYGGICEQKCDALLNDFFENLRK
jgi:tRNA(adenine34) deaminase